MKVRDIIKRLEEAGWVYRATSGDHHNFKKAGSAYVITITGRPGQDVSPGQLSDIRKKSGLPLR